MAVRVLVASMSEGGGHAVWLGSSKGSVVCRSHTSDEDAKSQPSHASDGSTGFSAHSVVIGDLLWQRIECRFRGAKCRGTRIVGVRLWYDYP